METDATQSPLANLRIVAGNLALDFVNTASGPRHGPADGEWLSSYEDFAAWSRRVGIAAEVPVESPARAAGLAALARVLACRDDMYEIFVAIADGLPPPDQALRRLQLVYLEALADGQLSSDGDGDGYEWRWDSARSLLAPLWTVVAAAVELLTHGPTEPHQALSRVPVPVHRPQQERQPPVVQHGGLWQGGEDRPLPTAPVRCPRVSGPATPAPPSPG